MLTQVENLAVNLMKEYGLIQGGWRFTWCNTKRSYGWCNGTRRTISLSKAVTPHRKHENILNTIKHEIAHALVGVHNSHNHLWKRKCVEIGARPEPLARDIVSHEKIAKWVGTCPVCEHKSYAYRKKKIRSSCWVCSPKFDERFVIVWKENI